jgi:hypothetical protein
MVVDETGRLAPDNIYIYIYIYNGIGKLNI